MELGSIFDAFVRLMQGLVNAVAAMITSVALAFGTELEASVAQFLAAVLLVVVAAYLVRRILWRTPGFSSFKPQTVVLHTNKTPIQVVWEDMMGCLGRVVLAIIIVAIGYVLFMGE